MFQRFTGSARSLFRSSIVHLLHILSLAVLLGAAGHAGAVDMLVSNFTDTPDPAIRGGNIVYAATITNNATDTAHGVVLTFALDPNTTYVGNDSGCQYNAGPHTVTCSFTTVDGDTTGPNTAQFISVQVTVTTTAAAGATVGMTATVTTADTDTAPGNDTLSQLTTLDDGADLGLALSASSPSVTAGGALSYTASVTNNGPNPAGSVRAVLTLSPNVSYQSASGSGWSCGASGQVVTCNRSSAAVGALPDITVNVQETGAVTGTITTTGVVSIVSGATDYNNVNDASTVNVTVTTGTDLALSKTASSGVVASGSAMSFTLLPRNLGPFAATSVTVTDTLPAGFTGIGASGSGWTCGVAGQTVTCTAASYAVGATNNITVTATAPTVVSSTAFTNTASITSATPDATSGNDSGSASVTVLPDGVDLSITKTRSPNPVAQGSNITNTIKVSNAGPRGAASGEVTVTDTLPAGESYVSYTGSNWTCGAVGSVVTCTYNTTLGVGASSSNLVLTTTAVNAGTLTNTACAGYTDTSGHGYTDSVSGNNCASASVVSTISSGSIDLMLAKTVSVDPLVWNAASLAYTLTVTNAGPGDATGVVLTDAIPGYKSGATAISAVKTGGTATATFNCTNGSTVTCTQTGGTVGAGATAVFTITVNRPLYDSSAQPGGKWTNTASVTSTDQGDTDPSNNSASVQVKVDPVADIDVHNTVTPTSALAGTEAVYVLTVNNHGPSTAKSVTLSDVFTIGAGTMTFVSATPSTGTCAAFDTGTNTLSCSLGDIVENGTATVTVKVRPDYMSSPPSPRTITNDATVSMTTQDSDTSNNTAQSVLTVTQASLDLLVNNTDSPDPLGFVPASAGPTFPDNVVTYRNVVTNRGPSIASGLVLTYTMTPPSGKQATFLGDKLTSTGQSYSNYCNNLNSQVTGPSTLTITCSFPASYQLMASNATTDLYLDFRVDTQPSSTGDAFASTVSIASNEPDSLSGNNTVSQTTTVRMRTDLHLAKSARAYVGGSDAATTTAQVRQPFYWVLTLTNNGPGDSQTTTVVDTLPSGVVLYTGGTIAPYNAAPYTSGVTWSTNNGTPTNGACTGTTTLTCNVGLLESGKVAIIRVPVVSGTAASRNNCASATTSEVDPNSANNTSICSSVTVRESSIAGTVYSDLDNNGAKGGAEPGINNVTVKLTGTDNYGNAVSTTTTTNSSGAYSFLHLSDGTYALAETQPANYQDGKDAAGTAGGTVTGNGVGSDAVTAIALDPFKAATGYDFGELADASISGYLFVDTNTNAVRDGGETTGISGATVTLTGTDDLGAVNTTATSGASGAYSFTGLRPGTYTVTEATLAGVTHTGMYVGSKGGQDGATTVGAGTAVTGAAKRTVSGIALVAGDAATNYNFGESGQGLAGSVYVDLNNNGVRDAGEPGIPGVSVTLSGNITGGTNVCVAISPTPCTVTSGADGSFNFAGVPASDATGYSITEQSQASAPLSNYVDGAEHVGSLGGSASVNDTFSGIVVGVGQFGTGYDFGEKGASIAARVYHDKNDNGADNSEPGIGGVTVTLSGTTASGANVCTIIPSCTAATAADGTASFTGLPASNGTGYTLTETQPVDYAERTNTAGTSGGTASVVGGNSVISGIVTAVGANATGYLFGEKTAPLSGHVYADTDNDGVRDAGENGIAGVTVKLSGTTASGVDVCTLTSCTAVTAADGSYAFANVPNSNGGSYTVTQQAQNTAPLASWLDGKTTAGTSCGACSPTAVNTLPSAISTIPFAATQGYTNYDFGELAPGSIAGHVYKDANANATLDAGEGLAGVTVTLTGTDDLGAVNLTATTGADGSYTFANLRPGTYAVTETQPATLANFTLATGTQAGKIGGVAVGTAAVDAVTAILLPTGGAGTGYDFREKPGSIAGTVYLDANDNGVIDAGETFIGAVQVRLTGTDGDGGAVDVTTTTATNGQFTFAGLKSGTYSIVETQPGSYLDGKEKAGTAGGVVNNASTGTDAAHNTISSVTLGVGVDATGYAFGELPPPVAGSIAGTVFLDADNDGRQGKDEKGIGGVQMRLTGKNSHGQPVLLSTATGADGTYRFLNVPSSDAAGYSIVETQPAAYGDGQTVPGDAGGKATAAKPVAAGGDDTIAAIVVGDGVNQTGYNFAERVQSAVAGVVYLDANANGKQDADEPGIAGVSLALTGKDTSGAAVQLKATTGADGAFAFANLAQSDAAGYTLAETQPAGYTDGSTTIAAGNPGKAAKTAAVAAGGIDAIGSIVVTPGASLTDYRFGEQPAGRIAGRVYVDQDRSGVFSTGDAGLSGVTFTLAGKTLRGTDVKRTAASGADGTWSFDHLEASDAAGYTVTETQPESYEDGATTIAAGSPGKAAASKPVAANGADTITAIVLANGVQLAGYDFGEYAVKHGAAVSGRVYADANNDGIEQASEAGIAGVTMQLSGTDNAGKPVSASTVTGSDGTYRFAGLAPSAPSGYRIAELQPAGWTDGRNAIAAGNPGSIVGGKPVGVGNQDVIAGVTLADKDLGGYDFGEVPVPQLKPPFVNGYVWLDRKHDRVRSQDGSDQGLAGWTVQLRQNGNLICTVQTDASGFYQFDNLHCPGYEIPGLPTGSGFSIAFSKDGNRMPAVAQSGGDRGAVAPTGGVIENITLHPGDAVVEQNLPLDPAGIVYDSQSRKPVAGAVVTIAGPAGFDVERHLVGGSAAVAQTVGTDGMYQFLLQNDFPTGVYTLSVTAPTGYLPAPSSTIPACVGTAVVKLVPTPALVQASDNAPAASVPLHNPSACVGIVAGGAPTTQYYQSFLITNGGSAPILNNHFPLDPVPVDGLQLSKTTPLVNVARGDLVPYTIAVTNTRKQAIAATVNDVLPPGFQYKAGSAREGGAPVTTKLAGRTLSFAPRTYGAGEKVSYSLMLVVGAGVGEGEYVNQAVAIGTASSQPVSNTATATVRIVPDPTFDCPDVIGKVFDDANRNGYQDEGERGIPGVRLATPRGLLVTTDAEGRWHVPCADIPNADRGSNFVIKLDDRTLPSGYRVTTENPGSVRITRGKVAKLNFGAAIHRVVRIELSDAAFDAGSTSLLAQWNTQIDTMMQQLDVKPSVVRIAYRRGQEDAALAQRRAEAVRDAIRERWRKLGDRYPLAVELEDAQ